MKTKLILLTLVVIFTSCEFIVVDPALDDRSRVVGTYRVEEYSQTYNDYTRYRVYIRKSFGQAVVIENFYNLNIDVRATVTFDQIYIDRQIVDGYEIEGVGTVYGNEIEFTYKVRDTYSSYKPVDFCNATAWIE